MDDKFDTKECKRMDVEDNLVGGEKGFNLNEKQEIQIFIKTALEIFREKKEFNLARELIKKIKRLKDLEFEDLNKTGGKTNGNNKRFSKKI